MDLNAQQDAFFALNLLMVKEEPLNEQEINELEVGVQESIQKILYPMHSSSSPTIIHTHNNGIGKIEQDSDSNLLSRDEIVKTEFYEVEEKGLQNCNSSVNEGFIIYSACYKCQRIFPCKEKLQGHLKNCRADLSSQFFVKQENGTTHNHSENEDSNPHDLSNNHHNRWLLAFSPENSNSKNNSEVSNQSGENSCGVGYQQEEKKKFQCLECEKSFARPYKLSAHMRTHTGERPYPCTFENCGKRFGSKAVLKNHMFTHTGLKTYICSFCNKSFRDKPSREEHERIHTLELPFVCGQCGRGFSRNRNLKRHITEVHSANKKKSSTTGGGMSSKKNQLTSTTISFKCNLCNKSFNQASELEVHLSSPAHMIQSFDEVENNFACDICQKTFEYQKDLSLHMTEFHHHVDPSSSTSSSSSSSLSLSTVSTVTASLPAIVIKEEILS